MKALSICKKSPAPVNVCIVRICIENFSCMCQEFAEQLGFIDEISIAYSTADADEKDQNEDNKERVGVTIDDLFNIYDAAVIQETSGILLKDCKNRLIFAIYSKISPIELLKEVEDSDVNIELLLKEWFSTHRKSSTESTKKVGLKRPRSKNQIPSDSSSKPLLLQCRPSSTDLTANEGFPTSTTNVLEHEVATCANEVNTAKDNLRGNSEKRRRENAMPGMLAIDSDRDD